MGCCQGLFFGDTRIDTKSIQNRSKNGISPRFQANVVNRFFHIEKFVLGRTTGKRASEIIHFCEKMHMIKLLDIGQPDISMKLVKIGVSENPCKHVLGGMQRMAYQFSYRGRDFGKMA